MQLYGILPCNYLSSLITVRMCLILIDEKSVHFVGSSYICISRCTVQKTWSSLHQLSGLGSLSTSLPIWSSPVILIYL